MSQVGQAVYANDNKSGIYAAKVPYALVLSEGGSCHSRNILRLTTMAGKLSTWYDTVQVLKAEFNRKGFPDSWAYFVHFLGWKKSHDKWVPASNIVWRGASVSDT